MSAFRFDTCMQKVMPQSESHINNALIKSQWCRTDADITWWRQHRLWKFQQQFTQHYLRSGLEIFVCM